MFYRCFLEITSHKKDQFITAFRPRDTEDYFDPEYIEGPEAIIKRDYKPDEYSIECVLDDDDFEKAVKILSEKFYIEKAKIEGVSI